MSPEAWALLGAVFGAGGLATIIKTFFDRRDVLAKARNEHIEDLSRWREEMHDMVLELQGLVEYYRSMAADFEYQLRANGIAPVTTAVKPETKEGS